MTREDILSIAQRAGWEMPLTWDESDGFLERLERFTILVEAARDAINKATGAQQ